MANPVPTTPLESLRRITVGIRHQRHFGIMDASGRIVDLICKDKTTPFGKEFFKKIGQAIGRERRIQTEDEQSYIDVTTDDLIFQYTFERDFDSAFEWIINSCLPFFKDKILGACKVTEYQRLGIVFGHRFPAPKNIGDMVTTLTSENLENPDTLMLRVSKKLPVEQALVRKNVNDWRNVIISMNKTTENQLEADIDIQHYFTPFVDKLEEYPDYQKFFRDAREILISRYHPMLNEKFFPKALEPAK